MPFEPLSDEEKAALPPQKPPCRDLNHDPPRFLAVAEPRAWTCPACGSRVVVLPPRKPPFMHDMRDLGKGKEGGG